jgi:hypothetical protein
LKSDPITGRGGKALQAEGIECAKKGVRKPRVGSRVGWLVREAEGPHPAVGVVVGRATSSGDIRPGVLDVVLLAEMGRCTGRGWGYSKVRRG